MAATTSSSVGQAIEALSAEFPALAWSPDGEGGAFVAMPEFDLGERWAPRLVTLEFVLQFNYPFAPVYPYYATAELVRADGGERPPALQIVDWRGRRLTQISLRANNWKPEHDSALGSVIMVRHWFHTVEL